MKNVKIDTIIRTIVLIIALFNQGLAIFGKEAFPITEDQIYQVVTLIATIASAVWAWWKNNSFTKYAIKADEVLAELKKSGEES